MPNKFLVPALALVLLVTTGAGCLSFKSSKTSGAGGVFVTEDAGANWSALAVMPTKDGLSSINGVDVTAIVFDPSDSDAIYIGTTENGMLYSYDNAETWIRVKDSALRTGFVRDIAVDPLDKCTIYVAKGNNLLKSTDCSRTWDTEQFVETNSKTVRTVEVDWYNSQVVWIGTDAGDIIRSTDGGNSWSTMERFKDEVTDILVDQNDSRIILASTEGKGLWRSTDGGGSWTRLKEEMADYEDAEDGRFLAQDKTSAMIYYASDYGIMKSVDRGSSWEPLVLVTKPGSVDILALTVNPDDPNNVAYATSSTLYVSTDGGTNWSTRALPTTRGAGALAFDPNDLTKLLLGLRTVEK